MKEGHCQAKGKNKAQNSPLAKDYIRSLLCNEDCWDERLYKSHPELCVTEICRCPTCKIYLCRDCWDVHDPIHLEKPYTIKYGVTPPFTDIIDKQPKTHTYDPNAEFVCMCLSCFEATNK